MKPGSNGRDSLQPIRLSVQSQTNVSSQNNHVTQLILKKLESEYQAYPSGSKISDFSSKSPRNPPLRPHSSTDNSATRMPERMNEYHMSIQNLTKQNRGVPFYMQGGEPLFFSKIEDRSGLSQIDVRKVVDKGGNGSFKRNFLMQRQMKAEKRKRNVREGRFGRGMSERLASVKKMRSQSRSNRAYMENFKNILGKSQSGAEGGKSIISKCYSKERSRLKALKKLTNRNTTSCDIRTNLASGQKLMSKESSHTGLVLYNQETTTRASGQDADKQDNHTESSEGFYLNKSRPFDTSADSERTRQIRLLTQHQNYGQELKEEIGFSSNRENNINFYEYSEDKRTIENSQSRYPKEQTQQEMAQDRQENVLIRKPKILKPLCGIDQRPGTTDGQNSPEQKIENNRSGKSDFMQNNFFGGHKFLEESELVQVKNGTDSSAEKGAKLFAEQRSSLRSSFKDFNMRQNYQRMGKSVRDISLKVNRNTTDKKNLMYKERGTSQTQIVMESRGHPNFMNIYTTKNKKIKSKSKLSEQKKGTAGEDVQDRLKIPENILKHKNKKLDQMKSEKEINFGKPFEPKRKRKKNTSRVRKPVGSISKPQKNQEIHQQLEHIQKNFGINVMGQKKYQGRDRKKKTKKIAAKKKNASQIGFKKLFKEKGGRKERRFGAKPVSLSQYSSLNYSRGYRQKSIREIENISREKNLKPGEEDVGLRENKAEEDYGVIEGESQLITVETRVQDISHTPATHYGFKSELISLPSSNHKKPKSSEKQLGESHKPLQNVRTKYEHDLTNQLTGSALELRLKPNAKQKTNKEVHRVLTFAAVVDLTNNTSEPVSIKKPPKPTAPPLAFRPKIHELKLGPIKTISHSNRYAHIRNKSSTTFVDVNYKLKGKRGGSKKSAGPGQTRTRKERFSEHERRGSVRDLKIKEYTGLVCSEDEGKPEHKDFRKERDRLKRKKTLDKQRRGQKDTFGARIELLKGQTFSSIMEEGKVGKSEFEFLSKYKKKKNQQAKPNFKERKEQIVLKADKEDQTKDKISKKVENKKKRRKENKNEFQLMSKDVLTNPRNPKSSSKASDGLKAKRTKQRPYFGSRDKDPIFKNIKNFTKKSEKKFQKPEPLVKRHGQLETREAYHSRGLPVLSSRVLQKNYKKSETSPSHLIRKNKMIFLPRAERKAKREAHGQSKFRISRDVRNFPVQDSDLQKNDPQKTRNIEQLNYLEFEPKKNLTSNKVNQKSKNEFQKGGAFEGVRKYSKNLEKDVEVMKRGHLPESPMRVKKSGPPRVLINTNDKGRAKRGAAKGKFGNTRGKKRQMRLKNQRKPKNLGMKVPYSPKQKNESTKHLKPDMKKKGGQGKCSAKNLVRNFCKVSYFDFKNQKNNEKEVRTGKPKRSRNKEIGRIEEGVEHFPQQRNFSVNKASKRPFCEK